MIRFHEPMGFLDLAQREGSGNGRLELAGALAATPKTSVRALSALAMALSGNSQEAEKAITELSNDKPEGTAVRFI
jgi:hypothetical protein